MKVRDVILHALGGKLTWIQAAEILGRSARSMRRLRLKFERYGVDELYDRRRRTPSPKRAPVAEVQRVLTLYRERYAEVQRPALSPARPAAPSGALLLCLRQQGAAERGARRPTPAARPAPAAPRAAPLFWRAAASRRQPASVAEPGARAVVHAARRGGRCDHARAVCPVHLGRGERGGRDDGPTGRPAALWLADGPVHRPRSLGGAHASGGREPAPGRFTQVGRALARLGSSTSSGIRRRAAAASESIAPCRAGSSMSCGLPGSPPSPPPTGTCASSSFPSSMPSLGGPPPSPRQPSSRSAASISSRSSVWSMSAWLVATTSSPPTTWPCNSPSNAAAGRVRGCGSSSDAISTGTTPSGSAPAALAVMAPVASPSVPPRCFLTERPFHGVKQLRPCHVSATAA